ncbi:MAG: stage II sporulation protein M [Synechococcales cyanobacterium]
MDVQRWLARREGDWKQLAVVLHKAEKRGLQSLSAQEIRQLAGLYRAVSGDLARAQTHQLPATLLQDLQALLTRAFSQIYQGSRHQEWRSVLRFYGQTLPALIRDLSAEVLMAMALFVGSALVAVQFAHDPVFLATLLPPGLLRTVQEEGQLWMGSIVGIEPLASSQIMTNNLSVAFGAIAGGITGGLYTVYILVYNGIALGAIAHLVAAHGLAWPFWAFVFPHGALELPAIFLAGAAGLAIGRALLWPGRVTRAAALKSQGRKAAQLLYGIVPLLVVAGIVEAFVSPQPGIPAALKYLWGLASLGMLLAYGRKDSEPTE